MPTETYSVSGSGTWTVPSGYRCIEVYVSAPGGAGGNSNEKAAQVGSGGGGQGGIVTATTDIPESTVMNYLIGNRGDTAINPSGGGASAWWTDGSMITLSASGGAPGQIGGGFPGNGGAGGGASISAGYPEELYTISPGASGNAGHDTNGNGGNGGGISGGIGGTYDNNAGMTDGSNGCGGGGASGSMSFYAGGKGGNGSVKFTYELYSPPTFSSQSARSMLIGSWI